MKKEKISSASAKKSFLNFWDRVFFEQCEYCKAKSRGVRHRKGTVEWHKVSLMNGRVVWKLKIRWKSDQIICSKHLPHVLEGQFSDKSRFEIDFDILEQIDVGPRLDDGPVCKIKR